MTAPSHQAKERGRKIIETGFIAANRECTWHCYRLPLSLNDIEPASASNREVALALFDKIAKAATRQDELPAQGWRIEPRQDGMLLIFLSAEFLRNLRAAEKGSRYRHLLASE